MRMIRCLAACLALAACCRPASAAIYTADEGNWPQEWGAGLEPLRPTSRTIGVATGLQENIYEIPIADRETFERVWPAVLKLLTPGGRITLTKVSDEPDPNWGNILDGKRATIRIYGPSGGYASAGSTDPNEFVDYEQLVKDGKALKTDAPWPPEIVGPHGELPEYVVSVKGDDGRLTWKAIDPFAGGEFRGFCHRARVDVELVVDGQIIDLNAAQLPEGLSIKDQRFAKPK